MTAGLSGRRFMKHRVNIIRAAFKRADAQALFLKRKAKPGGNQGFPPPEESAASINLRMTALRDNPNGV